MLVYSLKPLQYQNLQARVQACLEDKLAQACLEDQACAGSNNNNNIGKRLSCPVFHLGSNASSSPHDEVISKQYTDCGPIYYTG